MEPADDAAAADSWETADIDGAMSRLILSARRASSSPDDPDDDHQDGQQPTPASPQQAPAAPPAAPAPAPGPAREDLVAQVDQFLREALEKPRERLSVLRMEQDILKFIRDPRQTQFDFQGLPTSYLRLAAHRLAQHYFLQSIAIPDNSLPDGTGSRIIIRKTSSECRLPAVRLADIPVNLPQEESNSVTKVAIKQRPQKNSHGMNSSSAHSSGDNLQKSVEERKEEYNKARARIFNSSSSSSSADGRPVEEVTLPNTLHRSTSLELNLSNRMGQGAEITLERSLTTTSASSRSNRSKTDKEPTVNRNRQNNRVAIFRDRESERKDPDYDRSYDRYMQRFDPGFGFNGGAYTIQPLYAPVTTYNTEFPQLGSAHRSPVAVEQQTRPIAQHIPGTWSAAQAPTAVGYGPPDGAMAPYSPGQAGAPVRSSVFMHASQQYAMPSHPGVPFVHPQESMRPFAQDEARKALENALGQKKTDFVKWDVEIEKRRQRGRPGGPAAGGRGWSGGGGWFRWFSSGGFWDAAKQTVLTILGIVAAFFLIANFNAIVAAIVNSLLIVLRQIRRLLSFVAQCVFQSTSVPRSRSTSSTTDSSNLAGVPMKDRVGMSAKERVVRKWGMD